MDLGPVNEASKPSAVSADVRRRNQDQTQARQRAGEAQIRSTEAADARRAENFARANEVIQQAVGANTRLSIERGNNTATFVYRAIDIDSGEVIREWPPEQFARLVESTISSEGSAEGQVIDEQA